MVWFAGPKPCSMLRFPRYVGTLEVAFDQTQKSCRGRQTRKSVHGPHQGDYRRRAPWRKRSRVSTLGSVSPSTKRRRRTCRRDNIERAIKKGTGELEGYNLEEVHYEGYGPRRGRGAHRGDDGQSESHRRRNSDTFSRNMAATSASQALSTGCSTRKATSSSSAR